MSETPKQISIQENNDQPDRIQLTRRGKLARGIAALTLLAGGGALAANEFHGSDDIEKGKDYEASASVTYTVEGTTDLGGASDGWGQVTAETLIGAILEEKVPEALNNVYATGTEPATHVEIEKILQTLDEGAYANAQKALNIAGYDETLPDVGDKLTISLSITADTEKNVSYEVVDARIKDLPNNQD